ncbi:MAG: YeeE/YedE family protein [Alphaproteobacteria bacterium]|nr:YeeE/YedE family protein [Alphaproteobacteria bacterium]
MRVIAALVTGLVFGIGLTTSGMTNPAKVLNFFDVAGNWDPSLALVMASALLTTAIGYKLVFSAKAPLFEAKFDVPTRKDIDLPLVAGASIYGLGWGLVGYCPGGVIPALGFGRPEPWIFTAALVAGMAAARYARKSMAQSPSRGWVIGWSSTR